MAEVVVVGAGLSGTIMAYELIPYLRKEDRLTLVGQGPTYHFVPSNPWVAVGWRERQEIEIDLEDVMRRRKINFVSTGARRIDPANKKIELEDGGALPFDYLVIATGPDLAFDEIPGFGPQHNTQSICHIDHAVKAKEAFDRFVESPARSSSARCRARPASAPPMNSPSFSIRSCASAKSATACR